MDIEKKIKELRLLPLFPDKNFNYTSFELNEGGDTIKITDLKEEANLKFNIALFYARNSESYVILGRVGNNENGEDFTNITEDYKNVGLSDAINKFNFHYEELAKKFNELLLETLKEELEKEKEKAKEEEAKEEQGENEQGEDEEGGEGQEGGDEQGGEGQESESEGEGQESESEGEGEGQEGDGKEGEGQGQSQGGGGKMSSKDIQNLIDQLDNQIDNKDTNGQSNDEAIDLEDFLKKVEEGKVDNDFTKNRNDKGLKDEIDKEKQPEQNDMSFLDDMQDEFGQKEYKPVVNALKEKLKVDDLELKRRFPTPDFVRDFVFLLGKNEIEDLSDRIGIEKEVSLNDKKSILATNLITELQNI
jgi:hypothetical protein